MQALKLTKTYEKYSEYKDSGVEWLGKIPKEWEALPLSSIFKRNKLTDYQNEELLSVYRDYGVLQKKSRSDNFNKPSEDLSTYQLVKIGDLAINKMKAWQGSVGISEYQGIVSPAYHVYSPISGNYGKFLHYLLRSSIYTSKYNSISKGIRNNQWDLDPVQFKRLNVLLPTVSEQKRIANYLDEKTAYIDQIIEKKQKLIELLKEETVSIAMNEQKNGKGKNIRIKNLFKLSEKPINIEDYTEYTALGLHNRGRGLFHKGPQFGQDIKESNFYRIIPRDLILSGQFAWEGAVSLASEDERECVVSHRYYLIREDVVKIEYLWALLMTKFGNHVLNESSRGSAGRNKPLNIKILLSEKMRVPSKHIEEKVESLLIKMNSARNNIRISIKLLEEYKSSLISNIVTGRVKI